jgi:DNA-binding GntR family transcriptional regulator
VATFTPLKHQKAPVAVLAQIRQAILSGTLPAGSQLREAHIAEEMGLSRSPIREALSRLEEEGLVEKVPFKGAFVASVSPESVAEVAALRALVEPYAVSAAIPTLKESDWKSLQRLIDQLDRAAGNDPTTEIEKHLAFHRYFYERCGNAALLSIWRDWESKLKLFFILDHEAFQNSHDVAGVHQELLAVIKAGDQDEIRTAFAHHVHDAPGIEVGDPLHTKEPRPRRKSSRSA